MASRFENLAISYGSLDLIRFFLFCCQLPSAFLWSWSAILLQYNVFRRCYPLRRCASAASVRFPLWREQFEPYLPARYVLSDNFYSGTNNHVVVPQYLSCSAEANHLTVDSCCVETFGGLVLATQFWDTYTGLESQGQLLPENTWGLHGLWPDFCNTSYTQYCDIRYPFLFPSFSRADLPCSRQFDPNPSPSTTTGPNGTLTPVPKYTGPGVDTFLEAFGKYDLLAWMNTYWINQGAPNVNFWAHEFSKHGTCYSTFDTPCYGPQYKEHEDVVDFFETAVEFYLGLPTWTWLEQAGITPSNTSTYTLSAVQGALEAKFGAVPYIGCTGPRYNGTTTGNATDKGYTYIDEVW